MAELTNDAALNACQPVCCYECHQRIECRAVNSPDNNVKRSLSRSGDGEDADEKKCAGVKSSSVNYSVKGAKDH